MSSNDDRFGVTFIWAIENFGSSWNSNIVSPLFLSKSLDDTDWRLYLYPTSTKDDKYISLNITRSSRKKSHKLVLDCELAILGENGSPLISREIMNHGFVTGHTWSCQNFVLKSDVFISRKNEFLPLDTLTVRCRLWFRFEEDTLAELHFLRTKIQRNSFAWTIKDFTRLKKGHGHKIHLKNNDLNTFFLTFELLIKGQKAEIEITTTELRAFQLSCNISILDGDGKTYLSQCDSHSFEYRQENDTPENVWRFPSFITKNSLFENKSQYLPMDVLTLRVDCFFYIGSNKIDINQIPIDNIEVASNYNQCTAEHELNKPELCCIPELEPDKTAAIMDRNYETSVLHSRFFHDMQSMFEDGILSDFTLTADRKEFKVHKNILSARSPVFRAMFDADMKEKHANSIDIPDLDSVTLQRLLLFVYTNRVDNNLKWDSAMNLYFAADKYDIDDLKIAACSILKSGLCAANACEILVHADLHADQDLKSTAKGFIVDHDDEIIGSEGWNKLLKENIHLTVEVFSDLYKKMKK